MRAALSANEQKTQAAAQAAQNKQRTESWAKNQAAVRQAIPDYDEVVGLSEVVVAPHVTDTILESDRGPEVAYYLAQHPEKADQINGLSPIAAARAIGRIEASLHGTARCSSKDQQGARTDQTGQHIVVRTHWHIGRYEHRSISGSTCKTGRLVGAQTIITSG